MTPETSAKASAEADKRMNNNLGARVFKSISHIPWYCNFAIAPHTLIYKTYSRPSSLVRHAVHVLAKHMSNNFGRRLC